jgi:hypothetical protein
MGVSTPWKIIKSDKSEYLTIWQVERKLNGRRQIGFFKFTKRKNYKYIGPLLANELICNRLAKIIGLPVAETVVTTITGHTGIISLAKRSNKLGNWNQVMKQRTNAFQTIINPNRLSKTFVFDIWVCNIDRSGKNIIVYSKGDKYDFYLIDHELALIGAVRYENQPWNSAYWDNVIKYTRGYHPALLKYMKNYDQLASYVRMIESIPSDTIRTVIYSIPPTLLSSSDKRLMEKILLRRKCRLSYITARCVRSLPRSRHETITR